MRLRPDELDLIAHLIDKRDSAHLSGHTSDPFQAVSLNGGVSILVFPGRTGRDSVPTLTFDRLMSLGVFHVFSRKKNVVTFDLVDDIRDRLEQLKAEAGQPSLLAREREARARAEDRQSILEQTLEHGARKRAERRDDFAARVGRWGFRLAIAALVVIYLLATWIVSLVATPALASIAAAALLAIVGVMSWAFRLDAFAAAHWVEAQVASRTRAWLHRFEAEDKD